MTPHARKNRSGLKVAETIVVLAIFAILVALFLPTVRRGGGAKRTQCQNNLKQITLALYNYEEKYQSIPPAYTVDANGQPLHSWRTLILPFLDENSLYHQIDLTQPWDAPVNAAARETDVHAYRCPSVSKPRFYTSYMGVVGPDYFFHPTEGRRLVDLKDGTSNTIMLIEASTKEAVHWMEPKDTDGNTFLNFGENSDYPHGPHVALADGTVRTINTSNTSAERKSLLTIDGGEPTLKDAY